MLSDDFASRRLKKQKAYIVMTVSADIEIDRVKTTTSHSSDVLGLGDMAIILKPGGRIVVANVDVDTDGLDQPVAELTDEQVDTLNRGYQLAAMLTLLQCEPLFNAALELVGGDDAVDFSTWGQKLRVQ